MRKVSLFLCLFFAFFSGSIFAQQENNNPCQANSNNTFEKLIGDATTTEGFTCLKQDPIDGSLWAVGYYYEEVINPMPTKCQSSPFKILVQHFSANAQPINNFVIPIPSSGFLYPSDFTIHGNNLVIIGYKDAYFSCWDGCGDHLEGENSFILSVEKGGTLNWMTNFPQYFVPQAIRVTPFKVGFFCPYSQGVYTVVGNIYQEYNSSGQFKHYAATVFVDPSQPANMNLVGVPNVSQGNILNPNLAFHDNYSDFIFTEDRVYCDNWGDIYTVGKMTNPNGITGWRVGVNILNKLGISPSGTFQHPNFPVFSNIADISQSIMYNECILKEDDDKLVISGYGEFSSNFLGNVQYDGFMYAVNPNTQQNSWFNVYDIPGYNAHGSGLYLGEVVKAKTADNYYVLGRGAVLPMTNWSGSYRCVLMQTDLNGENPVAKEFDIKIYRKKNLISMGNFVYFVGSKINPLTGSEDAVLVKQNMNLSNTEDCVLKVDVSHTGYNIENYQLDIASLEIEVPYFEENPPVCNPNLETVCVCVSKESVNNRFANNKEIESENISVHPTPTKNDLLVSNLSEMGIIYKVEVLNINGQSLYKQKVDEEKVEIELNVSQLPKGIYILKIDAENGQKAMKFVKE